MMRLFSRRQDSPSSERQTGSVPPRAGDRPERHVRRRLRPEAEALDTRLLMASSTPATVAATASSDVANRVAQALQPYFAQDQFPGISVAVVNDGQVALAQGYGLSNVATGTASKADTRFDIGSVTKTFTAVGVLLLYQESEGTSHPLNLNAPISDYLHNNKSFKLPAKWSQITTMELLNMTSGIRDVGGNQPWQSELRSIAKDPLLFTPGTESSYSDANYDLLGELIEQWTGESYGTFIQDQILGPLGMSNTEVLGRSATVPNQAVGYDAPKHGKWPKANVQNGLAMFASAGIVSTAQDMATYMTALLSGRILDPATYALMWTSTPTPQFGVTPASDAIRGLGWDTAIDTSTGPTEVAKTGQIPGFNSELILFPSSDSGVFVSFNSRYQGSRAAAGVSAVQVAESVYVAAQNGPATGG
jgi:D-alanyl-D-alanine carboxypeptidase